MSDHNSPLDLVLRRRAAYKTLSEVLAGPQLLQAMWMIEERDHKADKFTFLGAVGPVKADGIMNLAINKTAKLPVAKLYTPKNFL